MAWQQSSSPSHLHTPRKQLKLSTITPEFSSPASPTFSSPLSAVQARRRSQYKSHSPSDSRSSSIKRKPSILFTNQSEKDHARQRFQEACLDRAVKARNSAVKRKRHLNSSPGDEDAMDEDAEDMDEDIMRDEFFRRIVAHSNRQTVRYNYVLSFDREVGSPINPDLEDVTKWERELREPDSSSLNDMTPEDLEIAELEAYAQECERQAALTDFDDVPEEELFFLDDLDECEPQRENDAAMDTT
ncbi:hypothetical protein BDZ89DRAFT_29606 [Hymenopellis radicata]|nr:hypothetical protein BDZ89DRAFT_29606 [Hymenopellis radicata]